MQNEQFITALLVPDNGRFFKKQLSKMNLDNGFRSLRGIGAMPPEHFQFMVYYITVFPPAYTKFLKLVLQYIPSVKKKTLFFYMAYRI